MNRSYTGTEWGAFGNEDGTKHRRMLNLQFHLVPFKCAYGTRRGVEVMPFERFGRGLVGMDDGIEEVQWEIIDLP